MTRHRLTLDEGYSFLAFGISCHSKDYRVAWLLNNALTFNFHRSSITLESKNGVSQVFSKYTHREESSHLFFVLLSNQNDEAYLLKEWKEYDFFLLIEGYLDIFDDAEFMEKVHQIEGIQFISEMETDSFQRLQYSIFEE